MSSRGKVDGRHNNDHGEDISLSESLEAARHAIDLFLNNDFDEARAMCEP